MDLGRLQRFVEAHLGKDRGEPTREHRFSGSGRTYHEDVVTARGGDLERAFRVRLSLYFREVDIILRALREQPRHIHGCTWQLGFPIEKVGDFRETGGTQDLQTVHDAGLRKVFLGKDEGLAPAPSAPECDGQRATNRENESI